MGYGCLKGVMTGHGESSLQSENPYVRRRAYSCSIICWLNCFLIVMGQGSDLLSNDWLLSTSQLLYNFPGTGRKTCMTSAFHKSYLLTLRPASQGIPRVWASTEIKLETPVSHGAGFKSPHVTYQWVIMRVLLNLTELWAFHLYIGALPPCYQNK